MSEDEAKQVFEGVPLNRRTFVKRLVAGAFAVPAIVTFSETGVSEASAHPSPHRHHPGPTTTLHPTTPAQTTTLHPTPPAPTTTLFTTTTTPAPTTTLFTTTTTPAPTNTTTTAAPTTTLGG